MTDSPQPGPDGTLLTILTTEHFVLQTARGGTIGEANGRAAIYLGAVSSGLIALGFVADDNARFALFAGTVLPAILVLGWFTFVRLVQTGVESMRYLTRIQRIRRWYAGFAPTGSVWFTELSRPAGIETAGPGLEEMDEAGEAVRSMGMRPSFWQMLYTAASMIGALNSLILGIVFCFAVRGADLLPLSWAVALGVILAFAALVAHTIYERREFARGLT